MTTTATIKLPRPTTCPASMEELVQMMESADLTFEGVVPNFGPVEPGVDARDRPWIKTDSGNNILGTYTYGSTAGQWLRDWSVARGTLRTEYRFANTITADLEDKDMVIGWELCDGTGITGLDLQKDPSFFQGAGPNFTLYTVIFIGYGSED